MRFQYSDVFLFLSILLCIVSTALLFTLVEYAWVVSEFFASPIPPRTSLLLSSDMLDYTFIGDDFPYALPVAQNLSTVILQVEESVHFSLNHPNSHAEWQSILPTSLGTVVLGPSNRTFAVPMFHELHCTVLLFESFAPDAEKPHWGHLKHCMNYIRQWALCRADLTLEPGSFEQRDFLRERVGAMHVCQDWDEVYTYAATNWNKWVRDWITLHGISAVAVAGSH
ncbi:uncharacterized protein EV420DRAFT_169006 [Desarmillaria tabescens]|uniref:Uncharacterized protein n=1 Tax=Armillaria tabescens TaxID=1929756 RepID=A0AA39TNI8_ARMTA|nr:uncharacterized protein EV420DRAFT_169006 [Desarmillaria tabescens]KAK0460963.1 hypothetical protein EV420DRAFT_169006 [Desarmillaria tabescens]